MNERASRSLPAINNGDVHYPRRRLIEELLPTAEKLVIFLHTATAKNKSS